MITYANCPICGGVLGPLSCETHTFMGCDNCLADFLIMDNIICHIDGLAIVNVVATDDNVLMLKRDLVLSHGIPVDVMQGDSFTHYVLEDDHVKIAAFSWNLATRMELC